MVGIDDSWCESIRAFSRLLWGHCVGQVHTDKSDVNVCKLLHLRNTRRVSGNVDPLIPKCQDITIATPFGVLELTR